ncbi:unnamed protein product [Sphenostylis stenocarpa]|uniref:Uncharacterized protein n=1 Tax=Sphenostylis stenocarpa TaxID=92480 RepID=A0AA86T5E5_9FABA|nr:unnamed protein product [Sphenostylis stenocarpa]
MRGLKLCCEGVVEFDDINVEPEPKDKIIVHSKTGSSPKPREATVIPAKRSRGLHHDINGERVLIEGLAIHKIQRVGQPRDQPNPRKPKIIQVG